MAGFCATLDRVLPSPTIAMTQRARDLKASGRDILSLTAGEPDFDTPAHIADAAVEAIRAGHTRYTAVDGIAPLKDAVCAKWRRDYGLVVAPDQVSVGTGGKQVIYNALMATLNPGDEAIILAPYWVSYPDMVRLAGGSPVVLPPTEGFRLDIRAIADAITPRSKWIILNAPGNPSGVVYTRQELLAVAELMRAHPQLRVMSDDIYEEITYGAAFETLSALAPDVADRVLTVNGVSKAHAMTGWRIGYGVGAPDLIAAMRKLQSQSTSNPCSIAQHAALAALTGPDGHLARYRAAYRARRDVIVAGLNRCKGIVCDPPQGAFYAFADVRGCLGGVSAAGRALRGDEDLAMAWLEEAGVGTVFGSAFGAPGFIRLSFAASDAVIEEALRRIEAFCAGIARP